MHLTAKIGFFLRRWVAKNGGTRPKSAYRMCESVNIWRHFKDPSKMNASKISKNNWDKKLNRHFFYLLVANHIRQHALKFLSNLE